MRANIDIKLIDVSSSVIEVLMRDSSLIDGNQQSHFNRMKTFESISLRRSSHVNHHLLKMIEYGYSVDFFSLADLEIDQSEREERTSLTFHSAES